MRKQQAQHLSITPPSPINSWERLARANVQLMGDVAEVIGSSCTANTKATVGSWPRQGYIGGVGVGGGNQEKEPYGREVAFFPYRLVSSSSLLNSRVTCSIKPSLIGQGAPTAPPPGFSHGTCPIDCHMSISLTQPWVL